MCQMGFFGTLRSLVLAGTLAGTNLWPVEAGNKNCPDTKGLNSDASEWCRRHGIEGEVHLMTFDSNMRMSTVYLRVSAEANGFTNLVVLGTGVDAKWGKGMQFKINTYRQYVFEHVCDCDIALLVDAGDVLVLGGPEAVRSRFKGLETKWNRSLFFGGEPACTQWEIPTCEGLEEITRGHGQWRFLNSGLIAGRGHTLKSLMPEEITEDVKHDQEWMRLRFIERHKEVGIDYDTDLFLVAAGVEGALSGKWSEDSLGQPSGSIALDPGPPAGVVHRPTGTRPLILHFPGPGKWPAWLPADRHTTISVRGKSFRDNVWHVLKGDVETCALQETFVHLFPKHAASLQIDRDDYGLLTFLPKHRPRCVGLDEKSPWVAVSTIYGTLNRCANLMGLSLLCCSCLLCQRLDLGRLFPRWRKGYVVAVQDDPKHV